MNVLKGVAILVLTVALYCGSILALDFVFFKSLGWVSGLSPVWYVVLLILTCTPAIGLISFVTRLANWCVRVNKFRIVTFVIILIITLIATYFELDKYSYSLDYHWILRWMYFGVITAYFFYRIVGVAIYSGIGLSGESMND